MDWATKKTRIETLLKEVVLGFLNYLLTILDETSLLIAIAYIKDEMSPEELTEKFCGYVLPNSEKIETRDESFFLLDKSVFSDLNLGTVSYFREIWMSEKLKDESKASIWSWFVKFNQICKKYQEVMKERPSPESGVEGIFSHA